MRLLACFVSIIVAASVISKASAQEPTPRSIIIKLASGYDAKQVADNVKEDNPTGVPGLDFAVYHPIIEEVVPVFGRTGITPRDPALFSELGMNRFLKIGRTQESGSLPPAVLNQLITHLTDQQSVEDVYSDGFGMGAFTPNDPQYTNQYHHEIVGMTSAWAITQGDASMLVAVVDSGISWSNDDLDYSSITSGYDYVEGDWDPEDEYSHGTEVAGIIKATGNNATMIAGVAWDVKVYVCRVLNESNSCTWSDAAAGIQESADAGASVINVSIQGQRGSSDLSNACAYAHGLDSVVVACMGNYDSSTPSYPAAYPETIAVGMTDEDDIRPGTTGGGGSAWSFNGAGSNYGPHNDVVAPGVDILTLSYTGTVEGTGTSFATPIVVGMAALLRDIRDDWDNEQVRDAIHAFAEDEVGDPAEDVAGFDDFMGYGRVHIGHAITISSASTNCALSYSGAMMMLPPPPPGGGPGGFIFEPYYWLRDTFLHGTSKGEKLINDYYALSPDIIALMEDNVFLTTHLVTLAMKSVPIVKLLRDYPDGPTGIPGGFISSALNLADNILPELDQEAHDLLKPWRDQLSNNPLQLFNELGVNAVIINPPSGQ